MERLVGGLLLASAAVVPLVFSIALDDVFSTPKLSALWAVFAVVMAVRAWNTVRERRPAFEWVPAVDVWVLAFMALSVVSFVFSVDRLQSFWGERLQHQGLATLLLYVGFFFVARSVLAGPARLVLLTRAIGVGASIVAAYAVVQWLGLDPIWTELPQRRVFSTIGQSNALGAYLAMTLPLTMVTAVGAESRNARVAWIIASSLQVFALFLTISRGAYLALAISAVVLLVTMRGNLRRPRLRGLVLTGVIASATLIVLGFLGPTRDTVEEIGRRLVTSADIGVPGSVRTHLDLWNVAGEIIIDHPLIGTGPDTYAIVFPEYRDDVLPADQAALLALFRVESPHNVYLAIATGSGLAALIAYLVMIGFSYRVIGRRMRTAGREHRLVLIGVIAAVTGHLIADLFITAEVTGTWVFWMLLGSAIGTVTSGRVRQA